ncbi:hypothetical protein BC833DRAFT_572551 [Globomyces pollinis-pini]|nr:hypothetical protein BC833DRAFT_572551 [Globomyces pollinis-pini]
MTISFSYDHLSVKMLFNRKLTRGMRVSNSRLYLPIPSIYCTNTRLPFTLWFYIFSRTSLLKLKEKLLVTSPSLQHRICNSNVVYSNICYSNICSVCSVILFCLVFCR